MPITAKTVAPFDDPHAHRAMRSACAGMCCHNVSKLPLPSGLAQPF